MLWNRIMLLLSVAVIGLFPLGCSMVSPLVLPTQTVFVIPAENYKILNGGEEVAGFSSGWQFLCFMSGNTGLAFAYQDALAKCEGATALINVRVDRSFFTVFGIGSSFKTIVCGIPVKLLVDGE